MTRARRRLLTFVAAAAGALAAGGALWAFFGVSSTPGSAGAAAATRMRIAPTPTLTAAGRSVTVHWAEATLDNGAPADGYVVTRYSADPPYAADAVLFGCDGTITGLSCTEWTVPYGSWQYAVTPLKGTNWLGPQSLKSGVVTIGASALVLDQTIFGGPLPRTATGSLTGFGAGEGIAYRLDDGPGTPLSGTPARADASGAATISVTIPTTADGPHTVYAIGDGASPSNASAAIEVDTTPPTSLATGADSLWHVSVVTLTLSGDDGVTGSGVKQLTYAVDGGASQTAAGASVDVSVGAPSNGSNDGVHTITFHATDNAGNVESPDKTAQVKIDTQPPVTTLATTPSSPDGSSGWFKRSSVSFTLAATDTSSGVATTYYSLDGGPDNVYSGAVTISTQGTHTLTYWSVDNAGNVEGVHSTQIKLDNVAPATTLATSPASPGGTNNWFNQSSVSFTLAATDATSGVATRLYTVDGGAQQTYAGAVTLSTQGDHTVVYWSVDNAGNVESPNTVHIKLDNGAPATTATTSPAAPDGDNGWFARSSVTFALAASDAASGVASSLYKVDGGAQQTYSGAVTVSGQGTHVVTYWSVDNAGNVESQNTVIIKLDNVAPTITLATSPSSPDGTNSWFKQASVTFTLNATDVTSGVAARYYTVDGGVRQTYSGTVTVSGQGTHTILYWSVDNAGNVESQNGSTIKVDNVAPSSTLATSPASPDGTNGWFKQTFVSFTLAATDATSGVASRKYTVDGGATQTYTGAVTVSGQGAHAITFWAVDDAGNVESANTAQIKLDSVAPSTTDNTAAIGNGWKNTNQTVTLTPTDTASGVAATYYTTDGSSPTIGSSQGTSVSLTSEGVYTIKYFSVDNAGNSESTKTAATQIRIDKTAPTVDAAVIANTSNGGTGVKTNGVYNVYANVADTGSGISSVTANVTSLGNGTQTLTACSTGCTVGGVTYAYKSASLTASTTAGTKSYTVTATDAATNSSGAVSFSVVAESTAPTVAGATTADATTSTAAFARTNGTFYVYANVSDATPSSGIATVTANLANLGAGTMSLSGAGGPWTIGGTSYAYRSSVQTVGSAITAGAKTWTISATDNAANTVTSANFSTTVDNTAPTTTPSKSPAANANGWNNANVVVTLSSSDGTGAGVASITYSATGAQTIGSTTAPGSSVSLPAITTEGTTTISYAATDNVGNVESTATTTVKLDKTNPVAATFTLPSAIKNGQSLTNAATDTLSGVASVSYYYCAGTCTPSPGTLVGTSSTGPNYAFTWSSEPANGTYSVVARLADAAGNTVDSNVQTTTVDNTAPTISAVALANGNVAKQADSGDTATITFSEALDATTFCSVWSNGSTQTLTDATATITNSGNSDGLAVATPSCTFKLGTIVVGDYVSATGTWTSSALQWNATAKTLTVTLGAFASGTTKTSVNAAKPSFTPTAGLTDLAGNALSTTAFTSGTATGF